MSPSRISHLLHILDGHARDAEVTLHLLSAAAGGHGLDSDIAAMEGTVTSLRRTIAALLLDEAGPPSPQPPTVREPSVPPGAPPPSEAP